MRSASAMLCSRKRRVISRASVGLWPISSSTVRALGLSQHALREETGGMFVVTAAQLQYHRPARLDDELLVTAAVIAQGRASLTMAQQALRKPAHANEAPTLLCEGEVRIGWVDSATLRPARIPNAVLERFA